MPSPTGRKKVDEIWWSLQQEQAGSQPHTTAPGCVKGKENRLDKKKVVKKKKQESSTADELVRSILARGDHSAASNHPHGKKGKASKPSGEETGWVDLGCWSQRVQREVLALDDDRAEVRKKALAHLLGMLFPQGSQDPRVPLDKYEEVLDSCLKPLFKRFTDPVEQCRELAIRITTYFFLALPGLVPYLAYFYPVVMSRVPPGVSYDNDLQVFVKDRDDHEAYKRGKVTSRQDQVHKVVEPSEEIRLLLCRLLHTLVSTLLDRHAGAVLHPYFHETILFFQAQLHDPFPDLKVQACHSLCLLAESSIYELGMKYYAVALVRACLPLLRHRLAKVRIAGIKAIRVLVKVPNRDKRKGAGTEAILDLVGFREDNVIPIGAFYHSEVAYNCLAEVAMDFNASVREHVVLMLSDWLTNLPDRYDYETRLLPYLLNALTDSAQSIRQLAVEAIATCGEKFEAEHQEDVIERKQFGVDGDERCNHDKPLPSPFTERPRLGVRLYVRGNTKRILKPLLEELCNWICKTRLQSARLLRTLIVYCEEHLVSEFHVLLPYLYKALALALQEQDGALERTLLECYELLGRYVLPDTYVPLMEPRLKEDPVETPHGLDEKHKVVVLMVLRAFNEGSRPKELFRHLPTLVRLYTDEDAEAGDLWRVSAEGLTSLLATVRGKSKAAVEAHFLNTGRLPTLTSTLYQAFHYLVVCRGRGEAYEGEGALVEVADRGLAVLGDMEAEGHSYGSPKEGSLVFRKLRGSLLQDTVKTYVMGPTWSRYGGPHLVLEQILEWVDGSLLWDHLTPLVGLLCGCCARCLEADAHTENKEEEERECDDDGRLKVLGGCMADVLDQVGAWAQARGLEASGAVAEVVTCCLDGAQWMVTRERREIRLALADALTRHGPWWWHATHGPSLARVVVQHLEDRSAQVTIRVKSLQVAEALVGVNLPAGRVRLRPGQQLPDHYSLASTMYDAVMQSLVEDGEPQVREQACQALHSFLYFLSVEDVPSPGPYFRDLLTNCLELVVSEPVVEVRQSIEGLLRMAAVVDSALFLKSVHNFRDADQDRGSRKRGVLAPLEVEGGDILHSLIDHGETLVSLLR